jgi:hypothetical protein
MSEEKAVQSSIKKHRVGTGIDAIIVDAEKYPLTGADMLRIANDETNIILYEDLEGVSNIDEVLSPYDACIILYQTARNFGHWVTLLKTSDNSLEFYDAYGLAVDEELNLENEFHKRIHEGKIVPHLTHLIEESGYTVKSNKVRLQQNLEDVNSCGRYSALRVRLRDFSMEKFNGLWKNNHHYSPDWFVSATTLLC